VFLEVCRGRLNVDDIPLAADDPNTVDLTHDVRRLLLWGYRVRSGRPGDFGVTKSAEVEVERFDRQVLLDIA
jgi:hypothetical protein